jgi:hypothetical protein
MLGTHFTVPFLAMMAGALFGMWINGPDAWMWGGVIGFGFGCALVALIWLLFAILKKMFE